MYSLHLNTMQIGDFSILLILGIFIVTDPLKQTLEKFVKFPIATSYEKKEPRLLLVTIDVQDGSTVVFDSYEKADGTRKTEYGRYGPEFARERNDHEGFEYVIRYEDGIEVDFVLASGSVPVNYDYTKLVVENCSNEHEVKNKNEEERNPQVDIPLIRKFATFGMVELLPILHLERPLLNTGSIGILLENLKLRFYVLV